MATDTSFGEVRLFEDFLGESYDDFLWAIQTGGSCTTEISEIENGVFLIDGDGTDGDISGIWGGNIWQPNTAGTTVFEARVALVTSITQGVFIGLSDENGQSEMPASLDDGTFLTTAVDVCGFVYDSGEDTNWHIATSKAGADGTQTSCAVGPTLSTYQTFRIVIESNGDCRFFIDGDEVTASGAAREAAVTTSVEFCPAVVQLTNGTAADVQIDYIAMKAGRV